MIFFLTSDDEIQFHLFTAEPIDSFADEDAGVSGSHAPDLENPAGGAEAVVRVTSDQAVVLVPLDDGLGQPLDGADHLDRVSLLGHVARQVVGGDLRRTWQGRTYRLGRAARSKCAHRVARNPLLCEQLSQLKGWLKGCYEAR